MGDVEVSRNFLDCYYCLALCNSGQFASVSCMFTGLLFRERSFQKHLNGVRFRFRRSLKLLLRDCARS